MVRICAKAMVSLTAKCTIVGLSIDGLASTLSFYKSKAAVSVKPYVVLLKVLLVDVDTELLR